MDYEKILESLKICSEVGTSCDGCSGMGERNCIANLTKAAAIAIETLLHALDMARRERDGRLVVLPCKVGDDVWFVRKFGKERCIKRAEVSCINIDFRGEVFVSARRISGGYIGKTVFLTREEAEEVLAQKGDSEQ